MRLASARGRLRWGPGLRNSRRFLLINVGISRRRSECRCRHFGASCSCGGACRQTEAQPTVRWSGGDRHVPLLR